MNGTDVVVVDETILNDECPCEANHEDCLRTVTHRVTSCDQRGNVCALAVATILHRMTFYRCSGCKRRASECWRLYPI